jgi:hypothetical protein
MYIISSNNRNNWKHDTKTPFDKSTIRVLEVQQNGKRYINTNGNPNISQLFPEENQISKFKKRQQENKQSEESANINSENSNNEIESSARQSNNQKSNNSPSNDQQSMNIPQQNYGIKKTMTLSQPPLDQIDKKSDNNEKKNIIYVCIHSVLNEKGDVDYILKVSIYYKFIQFLKNVIIRSPSGYMAVYECINMEETQDENNNYTGIKCFLKFLSYPFINSAGNYSVLSYTKSIFEEENYDVCNNIIIIDEIMKEIYLPFEFTENHICKLSYKMEKNIKPESPIIDTISRNFNIAKYLIIKIIREAYKEKKELNSLHLMFLNILDKRLNKYIKKRSKFSRILSILYNLITGCCKEKPTKFRAANNGNI